MTGKQYRVFDFRDIAALDDAAADFRNWLSKSSSFFSDFWADATDYGAQLSLGKISTETYGKLLAKTSKENYCCLAEIGDQFSMMFYASIESLRLLLSEFLALPDAETMVGDDLTSVELSLLELLTEELCRSLVDGWMGDEQIEIKTETWARDPQKTRIFRVKDLVTKTSVSVAGKNGTVEIDWIVPKQKMSDLLECSVDKRHQREPASPTEDVVGRVPMELVTVLGTVSLPMTRLSQLEVGETILLDQRIDQPIVATVNEAPFFECWPGRIGRRQALEISQCVNR
ncbi:MAG: FliM/FliN family flagellar motor C-terminal domain-containing protein [Planctomycetota bacterium]